MPTRSRSPFFFFNDTATTEIYTLSLHDALPIYMRLRTGDGSIEARDLDGKVEADSGDGHIRIAGRFDALNVKTDRKSTRLNSSHSQISYAVFCLKKKNKMITRDWSIVT